MGKEGEELMELDYFRNMIDRGLVYEALAQQLKMATQIRWETYNDVATNEVVCSVYRKDDLEWRTRYAQILFVESPEAADHVRMETHKAAADVCDRVLRAVDWDRFYDSPKLLSAREREIIHLLEDHILTVCEARAIETRPVWCEVDVCPASICNGPHYQHHCGDSIITYRFDNKGPCPFCKEPYFN